jgi:signal transduction histidine kinase
MVNLSPTALAAIALLSGAWLAIALWATVRGLGRGRDAAARIDATRHHEALLAASPALPLIVRRDGSLEEAERVALALGLADTPLRIGGLGDSLVEEDRESLLGQVAATAATAAAFALSIRPAGSTRVYRVSGGPAPASYPAGTALLWFTDATESEREMAALRERCERLAAALDALSGLIEAAPFPIWHRGPDLRLTMVNSAYVAAVEAEDGRAVIEGGLELVDDGEAGAIAEAAAVRQSGLPNARNVPATVGGERRMMRVVEVPLGEAGVAGYAIDVEDREQARSELARFVHAQRDMLDRLSAGVAQFARDRGLIFSNQPFARLFALRPDFLADRPEFNRLLDAMRETGHLPEVRDYPEWKKEHDRWFTGGLAAEEEDWLLPGGRHLRVVAQPLPDGGLLLIFEDRTEQLRLASARDTLLRVRTATFDNLFEAVPLPDGNALFTMLDVTASRTVEAALRERTQALEQADRLKTAFVSNMSYELRTPLTSIGGFAEMLAGGYAGKLEPTASEYVTAILDSVARLGALIDDVLDLTQSDSGSLLLAEDRVDLARLCAEAAEAFREQAAKKDIDFAVEIEAGAGSIAGDRARLRQSLDNVLKNAVAYTGTGGRVLLHAAGNRKEAAITVSDNGRGIAPADQARVFDRFSRTAEPRGADGAALGLGLPLAKQFVEAHGGTIELVSEPGEGTTVTLRLPRKR